MGCKNNYSKENINRNENNQIVGLSSCVPVCVSVCACVCGMPHWPTVLTLFSCGKSINRTQAKHGQKLVPQRNEVESAQIFIHATIFLRLNLFLLFSFLQSSARCRAVICINHNYLSIDKRSQHARRV